MDIDFVVLWVDGSDPVWQAEKAKYQGKTLDDSNAPNRFRDWGLMPYWFRAVEKFAPWVRKIHFVTCGHVPAFLNLAHPKLHHVKHEGFLPPEVLPTFSSHAIEMNLLHDEQQHSPFPDSVHFRHEITVWIPDQCHEKGGSKCQLQRLPESIQIQRFQYSLIIVQGECKVHAPDLCSL